MKKAHLSVNTIDNGKLSAAIDGKVQEAINDMLTRDKIGAKRKIILSIEFEPDFDETSGMLTPIIDWNLNHKFPGVSGSTTRAFVESGSGRVWLNEGRNELQTNIFQVYSSEDEKGDRR